MATWTTSFNNVPGQASVTAQAQNVALALKNLILAAGGSVIGSSNSVAAGLDAVDRWAAASDLVWNSAGNAHSWIVLRDAHDLYWLIACSTGTGSPHLVNVTFGTTSFTGGSVTADPTAITAGNMRSLANKQFLRSTLANSKFHTWRSDRGDWLFGVSADLSGRVMTMWGSLLCENNEVGDLYPQTAFAAFADSGNGGFVRTNLASASHAAQWQNSGALAAGSNWGPQQYGGTDVMSQFTSLGSGVSGRYPGLPVLLFSQAIPALRGTLVDIEFAPGGTGVLQFTEDPASPATAERLIIGDFWVPSGGTSLSA